jgi:small-conductance mechanosensitive channel
MNAFKIGDRVKIADAVGEVVEKTIFVTRVRTPKNVEIAIPNSMVMTHHIINYSARARSTGVTLHTSITIGYDVPWRRVHELLVAAGKETEGIEADPEPFVLQTSLDDYYVAYELNAVTKQPDRMDALYSELHEHIQDKFHEAGVEIASPHLRALRDGNTVNVPKENLPRDYRPAAFRLLPLGGTWTRNPEPEGAS